MKEVIIKLGEGQIETGFSSVNIELKQHGKTRWEDRDSLAAAPALKELLTQWLFLYPTVLNLSSNPRSSVVEFEDNGPTNISIQDIEQIEHNLRRSLNEWLNRGNFSRIVGRIRTALKPEDRIVITIVSEQQDIWKLPWHFWNIFEDYPQAVEVFCKPSFANVRDVRLHRDGKVNILGLFGEDPALDLQPGFLATLPQSSVKVLETASAYQISDVLTSNKSWDIFIFNGHGDTVENEVIDSREGLIYLNNQTPLEIGRLRNDLKLAVDRGLQVAIFNCCMGLGLADRLSDVNLPYIIVMREKIPDRVAQNFLADLLTQYSSKGDSFPKAFRYARQRLVLSDGDFAKFTDWLPVLFHNPLSHHVTWQDLAAPAFQLPIPHQIKSLCDYLSQPRQRIWTIMVSSLLVTILALSLKSHPQMVEVDNNVIDRVQSFQAAQVVSNTSKVVIINYDLDNIIKSKSTIASDSNELERVIGQIEKQAKPQAWGIEIDFERSNLRTGANILSCNPQNDLNTTDLNYSLIKSNCGDRPLPIQLLELNNLPPPFQQVIRLNPDLSNKNRQPIDLSQISKLSDREIKKLFDRKFVLVGIFEPKSILAKDALALDRLLLAKDRVQPIPLVVPWSSGRELMWIFLWSVLTTFAAWQVKWRFLVPLASGLQIAIAGLLLMFGQGVPIAIGIIATTIGCLVISIVRQVAARPRATISE